uniref:Nuclear envelope phosphatase-regulatory subunit 1 n=1 Tax=Pipistrellus kuhlii TaxID=59472 RepID=A0A7J7UZU6_PIPKU|nr:CTD nuclear envelope phosphatase 1 regulatory subunit 1 [Pipistrellus kuhlii]
MNSLEQAEDLKAFERRLTEYIHCLQPATGRWRMLLIVVSVCTATGAWNWLIDPETQKVSFLTSLWNHPFFTLSCITLIGLFFAGIHKRVVAPSIIAARCRTILAEYNMSCDDPGSSLSSDLAPQQPQPSRGGGGGRQRDRRQPVQYSPGGSAAGTPGSAPPDQRPTRDQPAPRAVRVQY